LSTPKLEFPCLFAVIARDLFLKVGVVLVFDCGKGCPVSLGMVDLS